MKKVFVIILFLASCAVMTKAEPFPDKDRGFKKEKYPVYYSYIDDYARMLYDKFDGNLLWLEFVPHGFIQ